jgi:hypothetical protein
MSDLYIKDNKTVKLDSCNRFIYEVTVNACYNDIFSMIDHRYFSSNEEILNVIDSFYITPNMEICCELYSAPLNWLVENDYTLYIETEKKKRKSGRQKTKTVKQGSSPTSD